MQSISQADSWFCGTRWCTLQPLFCLGGHVSLAGAVTTNVFSQQKFCRLSRQNVCRDKRKAYFCRDKPMFVATEHVFVATMFATKRLSRQIRVVLLFFCRHRHDKHVSRQNIAPLLDFYKIFCHDKLNFVATKVMSRQAYFCRDKRRVLSRQTRVCRDKTDTCGNSRQW